MRADLVIKGAVLSEKAVGLSAAKVYSLKVDAKATKADITKAIKQVFDVDVVNVNTLVVRGKTTRKMRSKTAGPVDVKRANFKKAYIRLKDGQEIPGATFMAPEGATTPTQA